MLDDEGWTAAQRVLRAVAAGPAPVAPAGQVAAAL